MGEIDIAAGLLALLFALWWSDSVSGFIVALLVFGSCFGVMKTTEVGEEVLTAVTEVVEEAQEGMIAETTQEEHGVEATPSVEGDEPSPADPQKEHDFGGSNFE